MWTLAFTAGEPRITLNNASATAGSISPTQASASYRLSNAGDVFTGIGTPGLVYSDVGDWIAPKISFGSYEARLTVNSGATPTGSATGTWLALSSTLTWTISRTSVGTTSSNCTIEIRNAASGAVKTSATVTLSATMDL